MEWTDLDFFGYGDFFVAAKLTEQINAGVNIFPPVHQILRALDVTKFEDVKVVILGQDPYPTAGHANGLAFSVDPTLDKLPKSLQNIYKELEDDLGIKRTTGDLSSWASQGVLLLNTVFTVEEGKPKSHEGIGWEALSDEVIHKLSQHRENIVFVLWGKKAQAKEHMIDTSKHLVLKCAHPSPLSARNGFFGCKHFSKINAYLKEHGKQEIDWR
jgi:uracil-DNA glycosylase